MTSITPSESAPASPEESPDKDCRSGKEQNSQDAQVEALMIEFNKILDYDMSLNPPAYDRRAMEWWDKYVKSHKYELNPHCVDQVNEKIQEVRIRLATMS